MNATVKLTHMQIEDILIILRLYDREVLRVSGTEEIRKRILALSDRLTTVLTEAVSIGNVE